MNTRFKFATAALALACMLPAIHNAGAQTAQPQNFAVIPVKPESWNVETADNSQNRIAAWVDPKTENRIEILQQRIVRKEHAEIFFKAFQQQLTGNNFTLSAEPAKRTFTLVNAQERTGIWTEYQFNAAEIPITVVTFAFALEDTAIIVTGFFARTNSAEGIETLKTVISQMLERS